MASSLPSDDADDAGRLPPPRPWPGHGDLGRDLDRMDDQHSPLLGRHRSRAGGPPGVVDETQATGSLWYMTMLTIGVAGLQIAWSVELSNGSPYLLSLGLSKSLMALVWLAGPLTGTIVVPYVGILSDNCRLPWGRRRPFMVAGSVATVAGLLFLAWVKEIVGGVLALLGADPASRGVEVAVIVAAVAGIYLLDVAINTVQAAIRAFIVDCAPAHQQELANAMASRLTGVGNIVGFVAGYANLPAHLWFFGDTQFKVLCAIACIALTLTIALSASAVHESDPRAGESPATRTPGVVVFFFRIFQSIKRLPPRTKRVCEVQFCAWIGFFPLLFYTSSYIGEIYVQPFLRRDPHMAPAELDALYEEATRMGTFALLINAIVSLSTNLFLPIFIAPTSAHPQVAAGPRSGRLDALKANDGNDVSYLDRLKIPGFTLKRVWLASLFLYAAAMFCAPFVGSVEAATALIGVTGVTWAMALWAPWAIIGTEIRRRDAAERARRLRVRGPHPDSSLDPASSRRVVGPADDGTGASSEVDQAGVILGIHNMAIAVPQILATVGSSAVFKIWQKPRGTPGDRSFATVMALGGACVLGASYFASKINDDGPEESVEEAA
ncbi:hypothetical protein RJ55_01376 [Drechmeria coniospora]|nr:hypothetical protein RJ55_01376 [Drechmeria coniospora]